MQNAGNSRFKNPLTTPVCLVCPQRLQPPAPPSYPYELLQLSVGRAPGDQDIFMQSETMRWVFLGLLDYRQSRRKLTEPAEYTISPLSDLDPSTIKFTT